MVNLLIYAGFNVQSEVCFWAVLGILRTILNASLASKVKSNFKQIWQMRMPQELDVQIQRLLRTMISSVMVVQCFTVYVYLAAYIVLLYPIFLEEKPALVLPWLLLSLIRLLCELVNLSIGLATCVLLSSGKPPCVKFVVAKVTKIALSVYMWKLVYSGSGLCYPKVKCFAKVDSRSKSIKRHSIFEDARLEISALFMKLQILQTETYKPIAMVLPAFKIDDERNNRGLELAIRRRRTKSLLSEEKLRESIISDLCQDKPQILRGTSFYNEAWSSGARSSEFNDQLQLFQNLPITSNSTAADTKTYEDSINIEVTTPRDSDRILDQFVTLILKIGIYLKMGLNNESIQKIQINDNSEQGNSDLNVIQRPPSHSDDVDSLPSVTSLSAGTFSYIRDYPQIFLKDKFKRKLLEDNKNVLQDKRNSKCSRISIIRIKSDSSNRIVPKRLHDDESITLDDKNKSSELIDGDNSTFSNSESKNDYGHGGSVPKSNSDEDT